MVGSAVYKLFLKSKKYKILRCEKKKLNLLDYKKLDKWFHKNKPDIVINCAGKVGGILDNSLHQSDYLYENAMIGLNLVNLSVKHNVKKLINLGSACIYPKTNKLPIKEEYLLSSNLEKTNEGYALAKILVLKYCQYLKEKNNFNFYLFNPQIYMVMEITLI